MAEQTRSRTSSKAKAKPKKASAPRKTTTKNAAPSARNQKSPSPAPPTPPTPVAPAPAGVPQPPQPVARRSNSLAVAAIICAGANFTFVPMLGGFAAAGLGAVAVDRERQQPDRYEGRGLAVAAVYIGLLTAVLPVAFVTLFVSNRITPVPFVAVAAFATWVIVTGLRGTSGRHKAAVVGGAFGLTAISVVLAIGLGFAFYFLMRHISIEIGSAIGDAFSQMFDGIGDAFGSCGDAIDF